MQTQQHFSLILRFVITGTLLSECQFDTDHFGPDKSPCKKCIKCLLRQYGAVFTIKFSTWNTKADLLFLLEGLHLLLVPDELLLHQQVVFDPLLLQQLQSALGVRGD